MKIPAEKTKHWHGRAGNPSETASELKIHALMRLAPQVRVFFKKDKIAFFDIQDFCVLYVRGETFRQLRREITTPHPQDKPGNNLSELISHLRRAGFYHTKRPSRRIGGRAPTSKRPFSNLRILLTYNCNLKCNYCQIIHNVIPGNPKALIPKEKLIATLEFYKKYSPPSKIKTVEITGGEPLLYFSKVKSIFDECKKMFDAKELRFVVSTNGTLISDEMLDFFEKNKVLLLVSLDGHKGSLNIHRRNLDGAPSFDIVRDNLKQISRRNIELGISLVVTPLNIAHLHDIAKLIIRDYKPKSLGINYLKYPSLDNIGHPSVTPLVEYAKQIYSLHQTLRGKGIFIEQVYRRLEPFVYRRIRWKDCSAQGYGLNVVPTGEIGPCKTLLTSRTFYEKDTSFDPLTSEAFLPFINRWPGEACLQCEAYGICGGGCAYNAYARYRDLARFDERDCQFMKTSIRLMIWDLLDLSEQNHKDIFIPSDADRLRLLGNVREKRKSIRASIGHQHMEEIG